MYLPTQSFQPLPQPTGQPPFHLELTNIVPVDPSSSLTFHITGDVGGIKVPQSQRIVAMKMRDDAASDIAVKFLYLVGDIVYYNGEDNQYTSQFYEPYADYPLPILAIPGNHDGDPINVSTPSLIGFMNNFCTAQPVHSPDAREYSRLTQIQPNCYWTLTSPLMTLVGLYTNVPEGGMIHPDQAAWFLNELTTAPKDRALLVSLHHPPYSLDQHHSSSSAMERFLDHIFGIANRVPDLILSGHVHNYQRFTRNIQGSDVPYLVVGSGGYWNLHTMVHGLTVPYIDTSLGVTLESFSDDRHGFLKVNVTENEIDCGYYTVPRLHESWSAPAVLFDQFTLDRTSHKIK